MSDTNDVKLRDKLANSLLLTASARIINVIGVPMGLAFLAWLTSTVQSLEVRIGTIPIQMQSQQLQIDSHDKRINRLEQPFFGGK